MANSRGEAGDQQSASPPPRPQPQESTPWWKSKDLPVGLVIAVVSALLTSIFGLGALVVQGSIVGDKDDKDKSAGPTGLAPSVKGEPLRVTKVTFVPRQLDHTWVMAASMSPSALARLNADVNRAGGALTDEADPIMRAAGAIEPTMSTVELELEGNRTKAVRIINIRAVAQCRRPLNGTLFYNPPQGATDTVKLGFELDTPSPVAQYVKPDPNDGPPHFVGDYFADHKYTLKQDDQVTFRLSARSFKSYCEYRYKFEMIVDGKPYSQIVDDNGRPFKVTAEIRSPDRRGPIRCNAYRRVYVGQVFVTGVADLSKLPPWNDPNGNDSYCG